MDNSVFKKCRELTDVLFYRHSLTEEEYAYLLSNAGDSEADYAAEKAVSLRKKIYKTDVYIRGLIEISNYCKNDCFYCGIRKSNIKCERYRLTKQEILDCCENGYDSGFRTFVLQGGEDGYFTDKAVCDIVHSIKSRYPECAVTLSLGEKSKKSYGEFYRAGADRYLLRHETADSNHYKKLHPDYQSFEKRMECLKNLKEIGFQTGCGFMVGSPYQTDLCLAKDLKFIEKFRPDMCGIGPFIPHSATPFAGFPAGKLKKTLFILSLIRLIVPDVLLPATTALGTIDPSGREKGITAGANVVMPNLSPQSCRAKYELYDNKLVLGAEAAENLKELKERMEKIGYKVVCERGDVIHKS